MNLVKDLYLCNFFPHNILFCMNFKINSYFFWMNFKINSYFFWIDFVENDKHKFFIKIYLNQEIKPYLLIFIKTTNSSVSHLFTFIFQIWIYLIIIFWQYFITSLHFFIFHEIRIYIIYILWADHIPLLHLGVSQAFQH